jgi:hypothetical protein
VEAAINAVLAGAAPRLVASIAQHRSQLLALLGVAWWLRSRSSKRHGSTFQADVIPALARPLAAAIAQIDPEIQAGAGFFSFDSAPHPSVGRWQEAVAALRLDPDFSLPDE